MIKGVFFDLYHTLIGYDPPREDSLARTLARLGIDVPSRSLRRPLVAADEFYYKETSRKPLRERSEAETLDLWARYQTVVLKEAGITPTPGLIKTILEDMQKAKYELVLFDDVKPALEALAGKHLKLGLISNADRDVSPLLDKLGILSFLSVRLTSQEAGASKPYPRIFLTGTERMGVAPAEALYVGDQWAVDVQGARGAGMQSLLLDRGNYFEEIPAGEEIDSLNDIANRI